MHPLTKNILLFILFYHSYCDIHIGNFSKIFLIWHFIIL